MRRAPLGLAAVLLSVSCEDACWFDDFSFVWHGANVTVFGYGLEQEDACAGSFVELDGHTQLILGALGIDESLHGTYRWISDDYWTDVGVCEPEKLFACTVDGVAMSRLLPHMHEVVHTITDAIGDDGCPSVLNEGLAEYFDNSIPRWWYPQPEDQLRPMLVAERIPVTSPAYTRAAHFTSFLAEEYGVEAIVQLCEALPRPSSIADWQRATAQVLATTLEQLLADYESYPICSSEQLRARLWGCGRAPDFRFSATDRLYVLDAGCSDSRATNAAWGRIGDAVVSRLVYVPEHTWIEVSTLVLGESGTEAFFMSQECAACSDHPQVIVVGHRPTIHLFRAGLHEVQVFFDKRESIRLRMRALP